MTVTKEQVRAGKQLAKKRKKILNSSENIELQKKKEKHLPIKEYNKRLRCFVMQDGSFFDIIQIQCRDLNSVGLVEVLNDNKAFVRLLRMYANDLKIVGMNFPIDSSVQQQYFKKVIKRTENPEYLKELRTQMEILSLIENHFENQFYFFGFWETEEEMRKQRDSIFSLLEQRQLVEEISQEKKEKILYKFNNKNTSLSNYRFDGRISDEERFENEVLGFDKKLIQRIQPQGGIDFDSEDRFSIAGDGYEACIHVCQYPESVGLYWLQDLMNLENVISVIDISPKDKNVVKQNINKSMSEQDSRYQTAKDSTERYDAQARYGELTQLYHDVQHSNEVVESMNVRLFVAEPTWEKLDSRIQDIQTELDVDYKTTIYLGEQYEDFMSFYKPSKKQDNTPIYEHRGAPVTTTTLSAGNPFHFSSLSDPNGSFFGETHGTHGAVFYDIFEQNSKRTHYNALALGIMGSGKSTLLKKILKERVVRGDFIRAFDVSGEYTTLAHHYGGKIITLDGSNGILNHLEILRTADTERESYTHHLAKLSTIYRFLKPSATDGELFQFENLLNELYVRLGFINPDGSPARERITGLDPKQYPIYTDLLNLINEQLNVDMSVMTETERYIAKKTIDSVFDVHETINNLVTSYGNIFNGHSSIENIMDTQIVIFNIQGLANMKESVFDAQIFSALSMCIDNCIKIGTTMKNGWEAWKSGDMVNGIAWEDITRYLILFDECHRVVNTNKLMAVNQLVTYSREARKNFGGIIYATHCIGDLAPEGSSTEALQQISKIFELCQYKFLLKSDSSAVVDFKRVFRTEVTDVELEEVPSFEQGETILVISGYKNIRFKVFLTDEEDMIFKGGA